MIAEESPKNIAVVILTFNEERHIARALESIRAIAKEVFVIDAFSTDRTAEIARANGAVVLTNPWINYARQFQWGLDNAPITADWIMRMDADEVFDAALVEEINTRLPGLGPETVAVNLKRRHIFLDRFIRHGGRYPLVLTRIWRRGHGRIENRWMDEHIIVWGGQTVTFKHAFSDHNLNDLTFFTEKHNKYATREAVDVLNQRYGLFAREELGRDDGSRQAGIKRFIKEDIYNRLPFWCGPLGYFLYRYFIQLGFLDGKEGLIYHFLQGFWYRFLVGAKALEFDRALGGIADNEGKLKKLEEMTGLNLT
ncbi:glycosyltransferase family 2 protein [Martelella radicis]|uniref:Glycosyltransferase involved in cell wall biosynthesis n=1 Tax=Martelella radicis TaxID=1397476 RepID=A0A7W6KK03_9HYPH|nr:glycosyltransferase family 2 protein [Martelella radicis]MBB4122706.1 glycosyltransferase involved in cell wall biosynthesis [Martelella radicis]